MSKPAIGKTAGGLQVERILIPLPGGPEAVVFEWLPNNESVHGRRMQEWRRLARESELLWAVWKSATCPTCKKVLIDAINQRTRLMNMLRDNRRRMVPTFEIYERAYL